MFLDQDSGTPADAYKYCVSVIATRVSPGHIQSPLPLVVDASDNDRVRIHRGQGATDGAIPAATTAAHKDRVMTIDYTSLNLSPRVVDCVAFVDITNSLRLAAPVSLLNTFGRICDCEAFECTEQDDSGKAKLPIRPITEVRTPLTHKSLVHIVQTLWGLLSPVHPSYAPDAILEAFVFYHQHRMWYLAGRTFAWPRWVFIEHFNCPTEMLMSRAWHLTTPNHPLRSLLLSSLCRRMEEALQDPTLKELSSLALDKFCCLLHYEAGARKAIDMRSGTWFADLHSLLRRTFQNGSEADRVLVGKLDVENNQLKRGLCGYAELMRKPLELVCSTDDFLWRAVLGVVKKGMLDFVTYLEALAEDTFGSSEYRDENLIAPVQFPIAKEAHIPYLRNLGIKHKFTVSAGLTRSTPLQQAAPNQDVTRDQPVARVVDEPASSLSGHKRKRGQDDTSLTLAAADDDQSQSVPMKAKREPDDARLNLAAAGDGQSLFVPMKAKTGLDDASSILAAADDDQSQSVPKEAKESQTIQA